MATSLIRVCKTIDRKQFKQIYIIIAFTSKPVEIYVDIEIEILTHRKVLNKAIQPKPHGSSHVLRRRCKKNIGDYNIYRPTLHSYTLTKG